MNRAPLPPLQLNPDLPPKLEDIINRALEKDRELRYQVAKRDASRVAGFEAGYGIGTVAVMQESRHEPIAEQPVSLPVP
jgi:hypothetical protein